MHLARHMIISKSAASVQEKKQLLKLKWDCILKALASILNSGQTHKWNVKSGLEPKQQMLLMPTALECHAHSSGCVCGPAQPCFFSDVQRRVENIDKDPETYSKIKTF